MTASWMPRPHPAIGTPVAVTDRPETWEEVRAVLAETGSVLLYARLADWAPEQTDEASLRQLLGPDWSRFLELTLAETRTRFAASRQLLKYANSGVLPGTSGSIEVGYGAAGRPYLFGCGDTDISLSHCQDLLLIGLTTRGLVGVAAERVDVDMYGRGLGRHICTAYEMVAMSGLGEADRSRTLVRLWTLKESYRKAIGAGTQLQFTEFGFGPDGRAVRLRRPDGTPCRGDEWAFGSFLLDSGHQASIAIYDAGWGRPADGDVRSRP